MDLMRPFRGGWASAAATAVPDPPRASVDASLIRERFNFDWATDSENGAEQDTYWWWARSIRVDPDEVIADDGEGNIWSVPFTTDGTDAITFGTPVRVAETYVPVAAGEGVAATAAVQRRRQRVLASALEQPTKPDPNANPAASQPDERTPMDDAVRQALARQHGLDPESATEDEVNAAVIAAETPETPEPEHVPGSEEPQPETPAAETPELVAASVRATLGLPESATDEQVAAAARELRDGAQAGHQARRTQETAALDATVNAAVSDGRIAPSARDAWRQAIDPGEHPDPSATARATAERERLTALPANRIPVSQRASTPDPASRDTDSLRRAMAASGLNREGRSRGQEEVIRRG